MAPIDAPSVPISYQLLKSVGHSTMALAEVVLPYIDSPNDRSWHGPLAAYRAEMQSALDGLDATPLHDDWKPVSRAILQNNIAFMDECPANNTIALDAVQAFATAPRSWPISRNCPHDRGFKTSVIPAERASNRLQLFIAVVLRRWSCRANCA